MKVLDAGTEQLSNADVLNWIKQKRQQHRAEDSATREAQHRPPQRPQNFMTTLEKHERFLGGSQFPYTQNPSVYSSAASSSSSDGYDSMREFDRLVCERIIFPVQAARDADVSAGRLTKEQAAKKIEHEQEMKSLSEAELLMIYNHAPRAVEMLQPMIDSIEERFTEDEQGVMLEIIAQVLRRDETAAAGAE